MQELKWIPKDEWATVQQVAQVETIWSQQHLKAVVASLQSLSIRCYLVGGVVRDLLLNRECNDIDLVVECSAEAILEHGALLAKSTDSTQVPLDAERGTVRLCFRDGEEIDLVSLQGGSLAEDLSRRDLSINAMTIDSEGNLADPFGGRADMKSKLVRALSKSNLSDDPLRVLRCLRFSAQLRFELDGQTQESLQQVAPGLKNVAGERICAELRKFFPFATERHIMELSELGLAEILGAPKVSSESWQDQWELLKSMAVDKSLNFRCGIALLLGLVGSDPATRKSLFLRLRLPKEDRRYLGHWWDGLREMESWQKVTPKCVFQLQQMTGAAFADLLRLVVTTSSPKAWTDSDRQILQSEAEGKGELRWADFPWSGGDLVRLSGRQAGAWVGQAHQALRVAWACGEVDSEDDVLRLLREIN